MGSRFDPDGAGPLGPVNVRRVEPRNTPSNINALFNFANFWMDAPAASSTA